MDGLISARNISALLANTRREVLLIILRSSVIPCPIESYMNGELAYVQSRRLRLEMVNVENLQHVLVVKYVGCNYILGVV